MLKGGLIVFTTAGDRIAPAESACNLSGYTLGFQTFGSLPVTYVSCSCYHDVLPGQRTDESDSAMESGFGLNAGVGSGGSGRSK